MRRAGGTKSTSPASGVIFPPAPLLFIHNSPSLLSALLSKNWVENPVLVQYFSFPLFLRAFAPLRETIHILNQQRQKLKPLQHRYI